MNRHSAKTSPVLLAGLVLVPTLALLSLPPAAWAGPCYGPDPCDKACPDHCTNPDCGPPDPCDSSCPSTYDPSPSHENDRSWLYSYDSLDRLISAVFGKLSFDNTAIVPDPAVPEAMQATWSLDNLGNWAAPQPRVDAVPGDADYAYAYIRQYDRNADGQYGTEDDGPNPTRQVNQPVLFNNQIDGLDADGTMGEALVYDRRGNLVWDGHQIYRYDAFSRLVAVYDGAAATPDDFNSSGHVVTSSLLASPKAKFTYDALGRLITHDNGSETEHYYYDGVRRIQTVVDKPDPELDETRAEYVYGPDYVDEFILQTYKTTDPHTGEPAFRDRYMLQDANYNVVGITDTLDGGGFAMVAQYAWEPYGTLAAADRNGPEFKNRVGHQGLFYYSFDSTNPGITAATSSGHGLYYNRNRWYSPKLGRFTTPDPNATGLLVLASETMSGELAEPYAGEFIPEGHYADGLNLLQFLVSNPISSSDPLGLFSFGDTTGAVSTGAQIYSMYSQGQSIVGMVQKFADGVSLRSIMYDAALDYATSYVGGKLLDRIVGFVGPMVNITGQSAKTQLHHVLPKFLTGKPAGKLVPLTVAQHKKLHKMLREELKARNLTPKLAGMPKGFRRWSGDNFAAMIELDGSARSRIADALRSVYSKMNIDVGEETLLQILEKELLNQGW